jgi:hypothetical protein
MRTRTAIADGQRVDHSSALRSGKQLVRHVASSWVCLNGGVVRNTVIVCGRNEIRFFASVDLLKVKLKVGLVDIQGKETIHTMKIIGTKSNVEIHDLEVVNWPNGLTCEFLRPIMYFQISLFFFFFISGHKERKTFRSPTEKRFDREYR